MNRERGGFDVTRIMNKREIARVIRYATARAARTDFKETTRAIAHSQYVIFRLTIGAGLRCCEIAGLQIGDVVLGTDTPHIYVRKTVGKGGKARRVPLWWDIGTLEALDEWITVRRGMGASDTDPVFCTLQDQPQYKSRTRRSYPGRPMTRQAVSHHFMQAIKCLGKQRQKQLNAHGGRHTFAVYMLNAGHSLAEVRDALGHTNIITTGIYLHPVPEDRTKRGSIYFQGVEEGEDTPPRGPYSVQVERTAAQTG